MINKNISKKIILGVLIIAFLTFLDLISKNIIFSKLEEISFLTKTENPEIVVFSFFSLVYVWNHGISFGMFSGVENSHLIFSIIQGTIIIFLFIWFLKNSNKILDYAIPIVIGGALGNLIDRIYHKAVADFLDFHIYNYHWPAFNLADCFVFIGVMILLIDDLILSKKTKNNHQN